MRMSAIYDSQLIVFDSEDALTRDLNRMVRMAGDHSANVTSEYIAVLDAQTQYDVEAMRDAIHDLGEKKKAAHLAEAVAKNASEYCAWYTSLSDRRLQMSAEDCYYYLLQLSNALKILDETDNKAAETYDVALRTYFDQFQRRTNL